MTLYMVYQAGAVFLHILEIAILVYVVLSWFRLRNGLYMWLESFVRPFVAPFRRLSMWITSRTRMPLDFSCWFALIGITVIQSLWYRLYILLRTFR